MPPNVIAVGQFERALNVKLDGSSSWSGEVNVVVAGASKEQLRDAFGIARRYRRDPQEKLLHAKAVQGLGRALGHALKDTSGAPRRVHHEHGSARSPLDAAATGAVGGTRGVARFAQERRARGAVPRLSPARRRPRDGHAAALRSRCPRDYGISACSRSEIESVRVAILAK